MQTKQTTMSAIDLMKKVSETFSKEKKRLTKSYFSGDKAYFNSRLEEFPFCEFPSDVYETINNLSSKIAQSKEY